MALAPPSLTCYRKSEYWNNFIGIEAELPASLNLSIVIEPGWCYTFLARDQASRHASMDVCHAPTGTERSGIWKLLRSSPFVGAGAVWCLWGPCIKVRHGQRYYWKFSHHCSKQMAFGLPNDGNEHIPSKNHLWRWKLRYPTLGKGKSMISLFTRWDIFPLIFLFPRVGYLSFLEGPSEFTQGLLTTFTRSRSLPYEGGGAHGGPDRGKVKVNDRFVGSQVT